MSTKPHRRRRAAVPPILALAAAALATALAGCVAPTAPVGSSIGPSGGPSPAGSSDPVTAQRAGYVDLMLSNSYAAGPETQRGIMSVISGYGGGYVTSSTLTGAGATEELTLSVVLGAGTVADSMQGEGDMGVSGTACFTYTLYYLGPHPQTHTQVPCPSTLTTATARATAKRQIGDEQGSQQYDATLKQIPSTLRAAQDQLFPTPAALKNADIHLAAADFAAGTDGTLHLPMSALAMPLPDGGCDYVVFRWIHASWVGGGTSGSSTQPQARAWVAPTSAACTGAAALAAGGFLTVDRAAGG